MANFQISMSSVALEIAARAFVGMTDKTGREAAILHSLRVYDSVATTEDITRAAAALHDVIEDTSVTEADLRLAFAAYLPGQIEALISTVLSVTRGYISRETRQMVFAPPPAEQVCDCPFRRCRSSAHLYDKEKYSRFIERSKRNSRGRLIKIADITDNCSPSRTEGLSEDEKGIVEERYIPALAFLRHPSDIIFFTPRQLARLCANCGEPFSKHKDREFCPPKQASLFGERQTFRGVK